MEFIDVVRKRRSIRKYLDKPVSDKDIKRILEMVNMAPSAGNLQAYKIYVVTNIDNINQICKLSGGIQRNFINNPPVILVFCANSKESEARYKERGRNLYCLQDATIACAYAQLTVTSLGLSSCWVGSFEEEKIKQILKIGLIPIAMLPIGYHDEKPRIQKRKTLDQLSKVIK